MDFIHITKDNDKGYCELFKAHYFKDRENARILKTSAIAYISILFAIIVYSLMNIQFVFVEFSCILTIIFDIYTLSKNNINMAIKKKKIAKIYPDVDINVKFEELELALVKVNILNYTSKKREDYNLNDFYYSSKKQENIIDVPIVIPNSLQCEKVKVKKMVKKDF